MTNRVLALITALCLVFGMLPAVFAAETDAGTLDNGMTWVLDESGTLIVSGTGPMIDFEELDDVPWHAYASSITQIVVEPGITTIGDLAFCGYNNVTSVSLPEGITSIGKSGISECKNLTDLTLPESLESIGEMAFFANDSLTVLELPSSVRTIGDRAFSNCESLLSMTVPEGVTEIGEHTFSWCENLTELNLPSTLTAIGPNAFMSCFKLESITIPSGITAISDGAFCQCSSLTEVEIPEGVTSIGYRAFYYCSGLTTVSLPSTLESIGDEAFVLCSSLTGFQVDENNPVFTNADDGTLYNKDFTTLYQVPGVTTSFVIPNTVTNVNYGAFWGCHGLTDVEIPDSVTTIGDWAFSGCDALTEVVIPDSVMEIGKYSFSFCDQLADVTLSENLTVIPYRAFKECPALTQISLPDGLQIIDGDSFGVCTGLTEITIPASVTEIDSRAFDECSDLWEVHFLGDAPVFGDNYVFGSVTAYCFYPAGNATWTEEVMQDYGGTLTWVAEGTEVPEPPTEPSLPVDPDDPYAGICGNDMIWEFDPDSGTLTITGTGRMDYEGAAPWSEYMPQVTTVIIGEGVTDLCLDAFHTEIGSSIMTSVSLPSTLKSISERAFFGCAIEEIAMPQWLSHIGREAFSYSNIREAIIPDSVTSIGENAFSGCSNLVSVTLPTDLETLYDGAFSNCENLTEVIKPHMPWFGHLYENTFGNCTSLSDISWFNWDEIPALTFQATGVTDLTFHPQVDTIGNQAFQNCSKLTTITFHNGITSIGTETFRDCENLTTMYFEGDCPEFSQDCFKNVTATCYYPADNDTWTDEVLQQYGGNLTWIVEGEEPEPSEPTEPSDPTEPSEPEDDIIASGTCGSNASWVLDQDGVLTLSGVGDVYPEEVDTAPWYGYRDQILHLVVEDGITLIWGGAFFNCYNMKTAVIADSVTELGAWTFERCSSLTDVKLSENLAYIGPDMFIGCSSLESIVIPDSAVSIENSAFEGCTALREVLIPDSVTQIAEDAFENCPNLTIYCYNLSFAHMYAEAYSIPYQILEEDPSTPVYNIHVTCNAGGTSAVTPNPSPANRYVLLEMQPEKGYALDAVYYECVSNPGLELVYEQISDTAIMFFMPESDLELQVYFVATESPFKDVKESDYFYQPVLWAVSYGITAGMGNGQFAPNNSCTRGQVVSFLWRAAGKPEPVSGINPFTDVKPSDYYYKAVLWAVENGITSGMSPTSFGPNRPCTRAQVVTFLYRAAGGTGSYNGTNPFKDVKPTDYYYNAVLWAVDQGITAGMTKNTFAPNNTCTRGQVVSFLYRFMNG